MLSSVIFIQILFIQIYSEDIFDCTGYENDSFHPIYNTNDCRYYWHCIFVDTVYMRAVKRICPAGTKFDILLNACELSSLVNCVSTKSSYIPETSRSTKNYSKLFSQKQRLRRTTRLQEQFKVLPNNSSQLTPVFLIEQLLKSLIAIQYKSSTYNFEAKFDNTNDQTFESTTEIPLTTTTPLFLTSKLKRRHIIHRHNLTLNILTSNERKIQQFSINQTHGILIHCNELRRRQLRDLIFRTTSSSTTTIIIINSSSKIFHYDILSLTIFINSFVIFTKISD